MFKSVCPFCFQEYTLDDSLLGKTASCRQCRRTFPLEECGSHQIHSRTEQFAHDDPGFDLKPPSDNLDLRADRLRVPDANIAKRFSPESGIWNIGDVILGIYEVKPMSAEVPFAEGGAGIVQRVYHREWDIDLAVKSPKPKVFQLESGKLNYEKEAQTWIELGLHPHIVTCYLVRRISNIPRLFAEFVPDGSLRDWMLDGRLYCGGAEAALLRILDIAMQFAWGLEYAHSQKLLHLDVKPANVLMSGQTAKVTDFGLAQGVVEMSPSVSASDSSAALAAIAASGMTPGYCSPEQYLACSFARQGQFDKAPTITQQSDIWSWAISVLAMFHGRSPCKKGGQTARKVFEVFLKSTSDITKPRIPEPLVNLLFRCFEEEPTKRPHSMGHIAEELSVIYKDISGMSIQRQRPTGANWTPESINNRAASMLDLGKPDEAAKLLDQAATMQPWHPEITYNKTLLSWRAAKITDLEALDRLKALINTRPQSAVARYATGLFQRERGDLQAALDLFTEASELEHREEFHRSALAMESLLSHSARCLERIFLTEGLAEGVMVDYKGNYVLLPIPPNQYEIRETLTGKSWGTFNTTTDEQKRLNPARIALSRDLTWELVLDIESNSVEFGFALKRVGAAALSVRFRPVLWKRFFRKKPLHHDDLRLQGELASHDALHTPLSTLHASSETDRIEFSSISRTVDLCDHHIRVYDQKTGKMIVNLLGHEARVTALAFSKDGHYALSGGEDRVVRLWELPSGRCLRTFSASGGVVDAIHFGKGGEFVLDLIADNSLRIWDVSILCGKSSYRAPLLLCHIASTEEIGRQQFEMNRYCEELRNALGKADYTAALKCVADASKLNGWESVRKNLAAEGIWDMLSRRAIKTDAADVQCVQTFLGHHDEVSSVALSLDGNLIASAGRDQTIRLWNISEQRCLGVLTGHTDWIRCLAMTLDAKFVVSGSWDRSVRVWNLASGQCVRQFGEPVKSITSVALNPQGQCVAMGNAQGALILWDVLTDDITGRYLAHQGSVNSVRFSRNGRYLVTGGDDNLVALWRHGSVEPVQIIREHRTPVTAAVLSVDMQRILSADRSGRIVVWNVPENRLEQEYQGHFGDISGLELLADERFTLSCARDMKVRLENLTQPLNHRVIEGHPSPILCLGTDVAGHRFATGCEDGAVRVWDIYWNYEFPGWSKLTPNAEKTLKILLSLYSSDREGNLPPTIDETILKRILLEMEYRGFGSILPEELKQSVQRILMQWSEVTQIRH